MKVQIVHSMGGYCDSVSASTPKIDCYCCSSFVVHFDPGSGNKARDRNLLM